MAAERIDRLGLSMMVGDNQAPLGTAFTMSITARRAPGSGISAQDRATTILQAVREDATGAEFITPGYVYPLRARDGGVLVRTGQTEGAVDLARLAGLKPAGVICEILKEDGTMARRDDLVEFAKAHGLKIVTVADIIEYRLRNETMVQRIAEAQLPTAYGEFSALRLSEPGRLHRASGAGDGQDRSGTSRSWCERIASTCPATCSATRIATPATCCAPRWNGLRRRARACCFI